MKATRYEQVAERILGLIHNGVLKEGDKVPSIRQLSQELRVSVNTVKEAYWKLESQNHITAVPQSGFYVKPRTDSSGTRLDTNPSLLDPQKVSLCRIYGSYQNNGRCTPEISLSIASLNPQFWPTEKMGRFFQETLRHQELESYNYLMTPGYGNLREQIARWSITCGLTLSPDEIVITNGCHEAVFLALMVLCQPGDTVVLESPIYFNLLHLLEQLKLKIIEIPSSQTDGVNLETLRFVLENHPVKAMFSISNFNNPVGFSLPSRKKLQLVQLLTTFGVPLIEDDIYGDITFGERPDVCKTHDKTGDVLLCSSFSKTIAPGLRVGWIVPGKYYDEVVKWKTLLNISTASINQIAIAKFLSEGGYGRHLRKLSKSLKTQIASLRACILHHFPKGTRVTNPKGGFLLWIELPDEIDTDVMYRQALERNILFAPGRLFSMKDRYMNCMRLNAGFWDQRVEKAVAHLGALASGGGE